LRTEYLNIYLDQAIWNENYCLLVKIDISIVEKIEQHKKEIKIKDSMLASVSHDLKTPV
jgi:K+-sensing histidine kinase KdpD